MWELVIGAVLGYVLTELPNTVRFLINCFEKDSLEGEWFHYFINYAGETATLRKDNVIIKRGYGAAFRFTRTPENHNGDIYTGTIERDRGHLVVIAKSKADKEVVFQRYKFELKGGNDYYIALALAQNYNGFVSTNPTILSKIEFDEDGFLDVISDNIRVDRNRRITWISR
jgi:hypothetical protein